MDEEDGSNQNLPLSISIRRILVMPPPSRSLGEVLLNLVVHTPHPFSENELEHSPRRSNTMTNSLSIGVAMKRIASFANSLKIFAGNIGFLVSEDGRHSPTLHLAQFKSERQGTSDLSRPPSPNMNIAQYASP